MLSGQFPSGNASSPGTLLWNVPKARKLSMPGTRIGLSSRRSRRLGWPISVISAIGPLAKRPSIAASPAGWWRATILAWVSPVGNATRSEEHTSELQSHHDLVCRLLLEKKKKKKTNNTTEKKEDEKKSTMLN